MVNTDFRFDTRALNRAPDSKAILKNIFARVKCQECGACCSSSEKRHKIGVVGVDPFRRELYQVAMQRFPEQVEPAPNNGFSIIGNECCAFLEQNGTGKACSVYRIRPMICAIFPFAIYGFETLLENGMISEMPCVVLSSACPPLMEAKEKGVSYVTFDEVLSSHIVGGKPTLKLEIPVLSDCLVTVIECLNHGLVFRKNDFLKADGQAIFPIA